MDTEENPGKKEIDLPFVVNVYYYLQLEFWLNGKKISNMCRMKYLLSHGRRADK